VNRAWQSSFFTDSWTVGWAIGSDIATGLEKVVVKYLTGRSQNAPAGLTTQRLKRMFQTSVCQAE
jgi:hypothetical protein